MNVLVVGATGGTGRATVDELLRRGHDVSALARRPEAIERSSTRLRVVQGDATRLADLERAIAGHDAVIVTLGIRENPLGVRLRGSKTTPLDVRSRGTANVVAAMRAQAVRRLVVLSSYGVGETRGRLPLGWRLIFATLLKPQIADTEVQERVVRSSELDWVLAQPVGLADGDDERPTFVSTEGEAKLMTIARRGVARFLVDAAEGDAYLRRSVALSTEG
jgi:uncharacterized protein YbjT (DUF2867 family)